MLDTEFFRRIISAGRLGPKTAKKSKTWKSEINNIIIFWGDEKRRLENGQKARKFYVFGSERARRRNYGARTRRSILNFSVESFFRDGLARKRPKSRKLENQRRRIFFFLLPFLLLILPYLLPFLLLY